MPRRPRPDTAGGSALPMTPVAGAEPPAGAPHEVAQPLTPGAGGVVYADGSSMSPLDRARQNERELAPLNFDVPPGQRGDGGKPVDQLDPFYARLAAAGAGASAQPTTVRRVRRRPEVDAGEVPAPAAPAPPIQTAITGVAPVTEHVPARTETAAGDDDDLAVGAGVADLNQPPPLTEEEQRRMPAASNTDSPARGVLRQRLPAGKEITGGFGPAESLQYYALTGLELLALVDGLLAKLYSQCENDLRFNEALTYPQVQVRAVLEISGFATDRTEIIPVLETVAKNPIELARSVAEEVCFVVKVEKLETDAAGNSVAPPDAIREELGLARPFKRAIGAGAQRQFVDLVP